MPDCNQIWGNEAGAFGNAIQTVRAMVVPALPPLPPPQGPPLGLHWAVDLDDQNAFDILRIARDTIAEARNQVAGPMPPIRNPNGNLPSAAILSSAINFLAAFQKDLNSGMHLPGPDWLSQARTGLTQRPPGTPAIPLPDPTHAPIPLAAAITAADDLLRTVRDAIDP